MSLVHVVDLRLARRGGVAIGDIYHDDEAVFGPGLVRAYDIESNVAKFPRICCRSRGVRYVRADFRFQCFRGRASFLGPVGRQGDIYDAVREPKCGSVLVKDEGRMRRAANRDCRNFFGARFGVGLP